MICSSNFVFIAQLSAQVWIVGKIARLFSPIDTVHHTNIVNLHLSAVTRDRELRGIAKQYQPVERDNFCLDLLDRLQELEWNGVVTLEYMPWLHAKVLEDRKLLDRIYGIGRA